GEDDREPCRDRHERDAEPGHDRVLERQLRNCEAQPHRDEHGDRGGRLLDERARVVGDRIPARPQLGPPRFAHEVRARSTMAATWAPVKGFGSTASASGYPEASCTEVMASRHSGCVARRCAATSAPEMPEIGRAACRGRVESWVTAGP